MRNAHCRTWIMARKLKNEENEKITWQELEYGEKKMKNVKNETQILFDLNYGEKYSKTRKT